MALTYTIEGKGVIANCDALTNDTGGTGTGDWSEQGGGTMTLTTDVFLYSTNSIAGKYASKSGFQQFDIGAGNELDFTAGTGTEDGQFLYMWVNLAAFGVLDTLANKGLAIRLSSDSPGTSNYIDYTIAGSDGANGWTGGWKLFVIDPTKTPSAISGTQSTIIASIRTLGVWIDTAASVRAESLFIDQIAVGSGLRIAGTSTTGWADAVTYCTDYANRAWGMLQERDGIYYAFGKIYIGDSAQAASMSFEDSGRVIQFGTSQYYESAAWKSSFDIDGSGIVVEDASTFPTTFKDGVIVGTDQGRSGTTFIGNADQNISFDLYGGNEATSLTALYGTTIKSCDGLINSGNDANHEFYSVSFIDSSQFDPIGACVVRNCTFAETSDATSALLWNASIDVADCQFIANTTAGIEHDTIISVLTGTADAAGTSTQLLDTGNFATGVAVNDYAYNETDGSYAKVTVIVSNDELTTEALTGGTDNTWQSGDVYSISPAITYSDMTFSGNTKDVNNTATGSDALFISKSGLSDPSLSTGTIVYIGSVSVSFEALDNAGDPIQDVRISAYLVSDDSEVLNTTTNVSGIASGSFTGATPADIYYRFRKSSTGATKYFNLSGLDTIASSTGVAVKRIMQEDTTADPTI